MHCLSKNLCLAAPIEELRDAVDLTFVLAVGKGEQLAPSQSSLLGKWTWPASSWSTAPPCDPPCCPPACDRATRHAFGNSRRSSCCMTMSHVVPILTSSGAHPSS